MVTEVVEQYSRVTKILESLMKAVQRDLENSQLKIDILSNLIDVKERLDSEGKEPSD